MLSLMLFCANAFAGQPKTLTNSSPSRTSTLKKAPSLKNLRINALMTYDNDKDVNTFGLYSYSVTNPVQRKPITLIRALEAAGGAIIDNGKIYTYNYSVSYGYVNSSSYYTYDATTGKQIGYKAGSFDATEAYRQAATALTKDPVTGNIYCSSIYYKEAESYTESDTYKYTLSKWDLDKMEKDSIAPLDSCLRVMAADSKGQLYGITMSGIDGNGNGGTLVKIDKTTGAFTVIGQTGIKANKYYQSAVIDPNTDTFYWFAVDDNQNANLYTVDLTTGKPTLIGALPKGDQVQGAVIAPPAATDGAPSEAENFKVNFTGDELSGTAQLTLPTETYSGEAISGDLNYTIKDGDQELAQGSAAAGSSISASIAVAKSGTHTITATVSNTEGTSPAVDTTLYIGPDIPTAPSNVTATKDENGIKLSWTAPEKGEHGKNLLAANLTYDIYRLADSTWVAKGIRGTEYTDNYTSDVLTSVTYLVNANNGDLKGDSALSNKVVVGESIPLPYSEDFSDENSISLYTIVDGNADGTTWGYNKRNGLVRYSSSYTKDADDWLFLPPVKLSKDYSYELTYDVSGPAIARYKHKLTVTMGNDVTAESQDNVIKETTEYAGKTDTSEKITIKPAKDGVYYIGFHVTSSKSQSTLSLDNIKISAPISADGPVAVSNLKATAGAEGALTATISFTSPTKSTSGKSLSNLTGFVLQRDGISIDTLEVNSVEEKEYTMTDAVEASGEYTYSVIAYNTSGQSEPVSDTIYVGIDTPVAPTGIAVKDNGDGTGVISWNAVGNVGTNGGYVNTNDVTYAVYDSDDKLLADNIKGTSTTLSGLNAVAPQKQETFSVVAKSTGGTSEKAESEPIIVGPALTLPFSESFGDGDYQNELWTSVAVVGRSYSKFSLRSDADNDGSGAGADYFGYTDGNQSRLASPKLDISTANNPYLTYWTYAPTGATLDIQVSVDGAEWQTIKSFGEGELTSWTKDSIDLSPYKSSNIRIGFLATITKSYNYVYIDNVNVNGKTSDGISTIAIENDKDLFNTVAPVYDLNGRKISDNASKAKQNLPKGIYIVNGRKFVIR